MQHIVTRFNVYWFIPPSTHSHTHITKLISKRKIHENCFSQLSLFNFNGEQTWHLANQHFRQTGLSRSIKDCYAKFWISNTGKVFLPFIRLMSQIRTILSVTHQHSSRRVDNCISSHEMKQDEKHHLILFFNGCTQTTVCTSFKDYDQGIIASYHRDHLQCSAGSK